MRDLRGVTARGALCANVDPLTVRCGVGTQRLSALLGDRNDSITIRASFPASINGGPGDDTYIGAFGPEPTRVLFSGGDGDDAADYVNADRGVRVSGATFDGRIGLDEDIIAFDVERIVGSRFNDLLTSLNSFGSLSGGLGDDILTGNSTARAVTTFDMGRRADGGDRIVLGANINFVDYSQRTQPINATIGFGGADDGEAGERDEIPNGAAFSVSVDGGAAGDTIRLAPDSQAAQSLSGNGGNDTLEGADGPDFIVGGLGTDTILANGGDDQVRASDGVFDIVGCGTGDDTVTLDDSDGFTSCERRVGVGALRLTPATIAAQPGEVVRARLSWRHPRSWRNLRSIELRLMQDGLPVGEITDPPAGRADRSRRRGRARAPRQPAHAQGQDRDRPAVDPARQATGRPDARLEVEATDTRGRQQLERGAGTIRVAR